MAGRGGVGIELDLDKVPLRELGLTPYEILLSESQERMLIVCERGREAELRRVFDKWDLHAVVIGTITDTARWQARWCGKLVADIPVGALTAEAPEYDRPATPPRARPMPSARNAAPPPTPAVALHSLLASPNVASKKWVFRQYDWIVQSNTIAGPGSDAAVLRIKNSRRGLALKVDSNPRACELDPYLGTVATVCEAVRNVACVGAHPAGITNCLNYGNPERPEIMWQFKEGVRGLADAARAFGTPVVSGNVSFYNETEGRAIPPTPTIAVVGILSDVARHATQPFKSPGDVILRVRTAKPALAASEYDAHFGGGDATLAPIDLAREHCLARALVAGIEDGLIRSAHDVAEGGLAVAIAEACFGVESPLGAEIDGAQHGLGDAAELFGEGPSTVIVSAAHAEAQRVRDHFARHGLECVVLGRVTADQRLRIAPFIDADVLALKRIYDDALPGRLGGSG
jgi:phosphoribosylformylglycinamidine synthase